MFEDSLVESSGRLASRHPWTTAVSFICQSIAITALLLLSLLYTESLPTQRWINVLQAPLPPPAAAPVHTATANSARVNTDTSALTVPLEVPIHAAIVNDEGSVRSDSVAVGPIIPGAIPSGVSNTVLDAMKPAAPPPPEPAIQKVRVSSGAVQAMLLQQAKPQYPTPARLAHVEGSVVLQALIGKDGAVQNLRVSSGHPLLVGAAIDAVKQWRYRPYYLNGEPVEVETQIVVNFVLTQN